MAAKRAAASKGQASKAAGKKAASAPRAASKSKASKEGKASNRKNSLAWKSRLRAEYAQYESLQERRKVVAQAIRAVYAYLVDMVHSNIDLAGEGNYSALKFLMEFAGVDELAVLILAEAGVTQAAQASTPLETKPAVEDDDDPSEGSAVVLQEVGNDASEAEAGEGGRGRGVCGGVRVGRYAA